MNVLKRIKNSYYVKDPDLGAVDNFMKGCLRRKVPPFPKTVQIETQTVCNGSCIFCPQSDASYRAPKGKMSDELFNKIVSEIAEHGVTHRISPYLTNEPFLDPTIVEKSRYIRRMVKHCKVVITTNAGVLYPRVVDDIVKDNPFRSIYISMQGIEKEAYEETMRGSLVFETTLANVEYLIEQRAKYLPKLEIVVTMVKTNRIDADRAVEYWKQRGVKSQYTILENRGGAIHDFEQIAAGRKRLFKNCTRLFKNAMITFDGDMVLCCVDYYRKVVLGNVKKNSIAEVWNSPRATEIRRKFLAGDLSDNPLCASCFVADD